MICELRRQGVEPLPGRSSIYRCLKRHNLIELRRRKKRRDEFRRWERERPMQLWQMDVMSGPFQQCRNPARKRRRDAD